MTETAQLPAAEVQGYIYVRRCRGIYTIYPTDAAEKIGNIVAVRTTLRAARLLVAKLRRDLKLRKPKP